MVWGFWKLVVIAAVGLVAFGRPLVRHPLLRAWLRLRSSRVASGPLPRVRTHGLVLALTLAALAAWLLTSLRVATTSTP